MRIYALAGLQGKADHVIFSGAHPGGGLRGSVSEANAMVDHGRQLLADQRGKTGKEGPPLPEGWHKEEASTSTRENAMYSLQMAKERG